MSEDQPEEPTDDGSRYRSPEEIDPSTISDSLCKLRLLGDDPFLRMQVFNLSIVDQFITDLEYEVLHKLIEEERTPVTEAAFLSAQSQMWIFAVYELLRTWRQRANDVLKLVENGGLHQKLAALEKEQGFLHTGKQFRAEQIKAVIAEAGITDRIRLDLKRTHILFVRLEAIRISLAKHEVRKKGNSVALRPGYGRINCWCGSLDYELENGQYSMGSISRRDIADEIRGLPDDTAIPDDETVAAFDEFMRGPSRDGT